MIAAAPNPNEDDLDLVRRVLRREPDAVVEFLERIRCIPKLVSRVRRRGNSPAGQGDLDDLVQEVRLAVLSGLEQYRGENVLEAWIHRICVYVVWRAVKKSRKLPQQEPVEGMLADLGTADDTSSLGSDNRLLSALDAVGGREAQIIRMRFFDGLELREIAERLDMRLATTRSHFYRGIAAIRERMA